MERFLRWMSQDPALEACFIGKIILEVIDSMLDLSRPVNLMFWLGSEPLLVRVLVVRADQDRAIEIQRNGIITRWSEFGGLRICTGYLQGQPQITIGPSADGETIEFTFL